MLTVQAYAKINLSLEIVGKRADGYHDLVSVVQEVTLADVLRFEPAQALSLSCDDQRIEGHDNLALRAATVLQDSLGARAGSRILLEKRIPLAAGLGGGSSDAAAVLRSLPAIWSYRIDSPQLAQLAERLGSDVPFFLYGGTCLVEGRGERVAPLPDPVPSWYVLSNPGFLVSTAHVFAALTEDQWSEGDVTRELAMRLRGGEEAGFGVNGLQDALFTLYPAAYACFQDAAAHAPTSTMISGSGPTVISRFSDPAAAQAAAAALRADGYWTAVVRTHLRAQEDYPCP